MGKAFVTNLHFLGSGYSHLMRFWRSKTEKKLVTSAAYGFFFLYKESRCLFLLLRQVGASEKSLLEKSSLSFLTFEMELELLISQYPLHQSIPSFTQSINNQSVGSYPKTFIPLRPLATQLLELIRYLTSIRFIQQDPFGSDQDEWDWEGALTFLGCIIAQSVTTFFRWLMLRIAHLLYLFI